MPPEKDRFLFEINHPGQAHLFKNVINRLINHGYRVDTLVKSNNIITSILDSEGIAFKTLGKKGINLLSKVFKQIIFTSKILNLNSRNNYSLAIGVSVSIPLASRLSAFPTLVMDDDDKKVTPYFAFLAHKNASVLMRPSCLIHEGGAPNTIYHNSFHELAYLHPSEFNPEENILSEQGLVKGECFSIICLSALKAHHDIGVGGITNQMYHQIINLLKRFGRVIVIHEEGLILPDAEVVKISPEKIHHLMAFSSLVISNGQTMCSEAACLGIPSVRINDFVGKISNLEELEHKWEMSFGFKPINFKYALEKIEELLRTPREVFIQRRNRLINEKIKLTDFLEWLILNYPESLKIMKENPDYQHHFK